MNRDYAYEMEDKGFKKLTEFNDYLNIQNLVQTERNFQICDASGYTTDGNRINVEYKIRNQAIENGHIKAETYTADTIFIEDHKVGLLLLDYVINGSIPLYVNFLDNCVIVYNLSRIKKYPQMWANKIKSTLYDGFELCKRLELPLSEAYIYQLENNCWKRVNL